MNIADAVPPPENAEDIASAIQSAYNNAVSFEEHCVQALTDDDEIDMAYYFFDDVFLLEHGDLAAYVLREDCACPTARERRAGRRTNAHHRRSGAAGRRGGLPVHRRAGSRTAANTSAKASRRSTSAACACPTCAAGSWG